MHSDNLPELKHRNLNLVIVDDEPNILKGLQDLFPWEEMHYSVICSAQNGKDALDYVRSNLVDVVLTDIRMPIMDGLILSKYLFNEFPNIIVVLLSAFADFEYAKQAMQYNVYEFITKPVNYQSMLDIFQRISQSKLKSSTSTQDKYVYHGYYYEISKTIKRYVEENYKVATLNESAEIVDLSPNYVSQMFHQYQNITFSDYLTECRMKQAKYLLQQHGKPSEVAYQVGYDNIRNFNKAFKRYYGVTPTLFVNKYMEAH